MISVYDSRETDFNHNGLYIITPISCYVTEELNGTFELEMTYPIECPFSRWRALEEGNIIKAPTPRGSQLFRIYKTVKHMDMRLAAYARHIFYDASSNNTTAAGNGLHPDAAIKMLYAQADSPGYRGGCQRCGDKGACGEVGKKI